MPDEKRMMFFLAVGIIALSFAYFFAVTFLPICPTTGTKYADIILGALIGSGFTALISFYFGSSKGSQDKDTTIDRTIQNAADVAKTPAKTN